MLRDEYAIQAHDVQAHGNFNDLNASAQHRLLAVRGEPLLLADWLRVVFLHFEVDPDTLQDAVPFELDLRQGRAYVSLVAFTMNGMRPRCGGKFAALLFKPIATHNFLNVRTYVRHHDEPAIHFMAEWLDNPLSVLLGPPAFGLPYRFGQLTYDHHPGAGTVHGRINPGFILPQFNSTKDLARVEFSGQLGNSAEFHPCDPGSLDEFLLERYTACNGRPHSTARTQRFFRIWHPPWPQVPIKVTSLETGLLETVWPWFANARLIGAHYSPGLRDVWMGRPQAVYRRFV